MILACNTSRNILRSPLKAISTPCPKPFIWSKPRLLIHEKQHYNTVSQDNRRDMEKPNAMPPRLLTWRILTEQGLKRSRGFAIGLHITRREETHATIHQERATSDTAPLPEYSRF